MDRIHGYRATRRRFLRDGLALGGLVAAPGLLAACGGSDEPSGEGDTSAAGQRGSGTITFWQYKYTADSAGSEYFDDAAKRFKDKTGIDVAIEFKSAEGIEQSVAAAANARKGFDSMLWWSGPTARNQGSLGNIIPLDDLIPDDVWEHKSGVQALTWEEKKVGLPFTVGGYFLVYNREILSDAGVADDVFPAANEDPPDWDVFMDACAQVKESGVSPLMWANKEGYFNEWWFYNLEGQAFDTTEEVEAINLGPESYQNEDIYRAMEAWKSVYDIGYFFEGGEVVPYEQHVRQLASGQAAMSPYFDVGGATTELRKVVGDENVGFSKVPAHRTDNGLYGAPCQEPNGLYIASWTEKQDECVQWLMHLSSVEEMNQFVQATQEAPGDDRWDTNLIEDQGIREIYEGYAEKNQVYPYDYATQAQYEALLTNGILFLKGNKSAEELCGDFDTADEEYLESQE